MKRWDPQQLAHAAGARLLDAPPRLQRGPERVTIDSRDVGSGALFVGLPGEHVHGGEFGQAALAAGAWGVLTTPEHAQALVDGPGPAGPGPDRAGSYPRPAGVVLAAEDPLGALQALARAWRRALDAQVIGVTGSTGKTSTKDLLLGVLSPHRRTVASRANLNTEIGLPLQILAAPSDTEVLVLEMGMRGPGQIAELARIAEPDVGVIVSIGPVHLGLLGSLEAIAAAKAELIAALAPGATAVIRAHEPLLEPYLRSDIRTVRFGDGGDVRLVSYGDGHVLIDLGGETVSFSVNFREAHLRDNLLAACAAACAVGVHPGGRIELALTPGRGQALELPGGVTLIDSSYNANPMSMRAALNELAELAARTAHGRAEGAGSDGDLGGKGDVTMPVRRIAVLGEMLELGPDAAAYHRQIGAHANGTADLLITVGALAKEIGAEFHGEHHHVADAGAATELLAPLLRDGDVVLVKGSFAVGLRRVCEALSAAVTG